MRLFKGTKTGFGCTVLNVFRAMNIIALISVIAASFVMLVKTFIVSKFYFFDAVTHIVTAFVSSKFPPFPPSPLEDSLGLRRMLTYLSLPHSHRNTPSSRLHLP